MTAKRPARASSPSALPNLSAPPHADLVAQACRHIESSEAPPTLQDLAQRANLSPHHFHRVFKAITGLTPKAYASAYRAQRVRQRLATRQTPITEVIYDAGFQTNSRFYEASERMLGMRPKDYRAGGARAVIHFAVGQCSLGSILVAQSERGVCAILLGDDPQLLVQDLQRQFSRAELIGGDAQFEKRVAEVVGWIEAPRLGLALPLDIQGTAFQERVWQALREIPEGCTASYSEIAQRIGQPRAVRAVAQACAANPLAVAIPCHRVVRLDGDLSGYRWGIERKRALLAREGEAQGQTRPAPVTADWKPR